MDPLLTETFLIGLASFRIASLLVNEDGPGDIFEHIRQLIGLKPGPVSGFLPKLFSCVFCMTCWTTPLVYLIYESSHVVVIIIAAASVALIVDRIVNNGGS